MVNKLLMILVAVFLCCESAIYSSFWAPLFDRRILNYRVDITFNPEAGRSAPEQFEKHYGYRGERLIADLGNGKGQSDNLQVADDKCRFKIRKNSGDTHWRRQMETKTIKLKKSLL